VGEQAGVDADHHRVGQFGIVLANAKRQGLHTKTNMELHANADKILCP
jgi:hypothetical protein